MHDLSRWANRTAETTARERHFGVTCGASVTHDDEDEADRREDHHAAQRDGRHEARPILAPFLPLV
jgi:hypothetical protein